MTKQEQALAQDYATIFFTRAGQRVLADLASAYGRRQSHTPGDPFETAFKEGNRAVILRIERKLDQTKLPVDSEEVEEEERG